MVSFETAQRPMLDQKGHVQQLKWKAECLDYQENKNGLTLPKHFRASWFQKGKWVPYFDGEIQSIQYHY